MPGKTDNKDSKDSKTAATKISPLPHAHDYVEAASDAIDSAMDNDQKEFNELLSRVKENDSSKKNDPLDKFEVACCYMDGEKVARDFIQAISWFNKALNSLEKNTAFENEPKTDLKTLINKKLSHTYENLAYQYPKNELTWFKKAAELDNPTAQYKLGQIYRTGKNSAGIEIKRDLNQALIWLRKALENSYEAARQELDLLTADFAREIRENEFISLKAGAELGDATAQYNLGMIYRKGKTSAGVEITSDPELAVQWLQTAVSNNVNIQYAKEDLIDAQASLGYCYLEGKYGLKVDLARAQEWLEKAATQKDPGACYDLGCFYSVHAERSEANLLNAIKWFTEAFLLNKSQHRKIEAVSGLVKTWSALGDAYLRGKHGFARDPNKAILWLEKAAEKSDRAAQFYLGRCLLEGNGIAKNVELGLKWLNASAQQDNADAHYALGLHYEATKNSEQALIHFQAAANAKESPHPKAKSAIKRISDPSLLTATAPAKQQTPEEKQQAQQTHKQRMERDRIAKQEREKQREEEEKKQKAALEEYSKQQAVEELRRLQAHKPKKSKKNKRVTTVLKDTKSAPETATVAVEKVVESDTKTPATIENKAAQLTATTENNKDTQSVPATISVAAEKSIESNAKASDAKTSAVLTDKDVKSTPITTESKKETHSASTPIVDNKNPHVVTIVKKAIELTAKIYTEKNMAMQSVEVQQASYLSLVELINNADVKGLEKCITENTSAENVHPFAKQGVLIADFKTFTTDPALNRTQHFYSLIVDGIELSAANNTVMFNFNKIAVELQAWKKTTDLIDAKLPLQHAKISSVKDKVQIAIKQDAKVTLTAIPLRNDELLSNDDIDYAIQNIFFLTKSRLTLPVDQKEDFYIVPPIDFIDQKQVRHPSLLGDVLNQIKKTRSNTASYHLYVPINLYGGHWALLIIKVAPTNQDQKNSKEKITVQYWDSLNKDLNHIKSSLEQGIRWKKPAQVTEDVYWEAHPNATIEITQKLTNKQHNSWVCGYRVILEIIMDIRRRIPNFVFPAEIANLDLNKGLTDDQLRDTIFKILFTALQPDKPSVNKTDIKLQAEQKAKADSVQNAVPAQTAPAQSQSGSAFAVPAQVAPTPEKVAPPTSAPLPAVAPVPIASAQPMPVIAAEKQAVNENSVKATTSLLKAEDAYQNGLKLLEENKTAEAVKMFKIAAGQEHGAACFKLSIAYALGEGVEKIDKDIAKMWRDIAVELDYAPAQFSLGCVLYTGIEGVKDTKAAYEWITNAAKDQSIWNSIYGVAVSYQAGEGVSKDLAHAQKLYALIAGKGHALSQYGLYTILILDKASESIAREWLNKSAAQNCVEAVAEVERLKKLDLAKKAALQQAFAAKVMPVSSAGADIKNTTPNLPANASSAPKLPTADIKPVAPKIEIRPLSARVKELLETEIKNINRNNYIPYQLQESYQGVIEYCQQQPEFEVERKKVLTHINLNFAEKYFELHEYGRAVHCYETALRLLNIQKTSSESDFDMCKKIYARLAGCYKQIEDAANAMKKSIEKDIKNNSILKIFDKKVSLKVLFDKLQVAQMYSNSSLMPEKNVELAAECKEALSSAIRTYKKNNFKHAFENFKVGLNFFGRINVQQLNAYYRLDWLTQIIILGTACQLFLIQKHAEKGSETLEFQMAKMFTMHCKILLELITSRRSGECTIIFNNLAHNKRDILFPVEKQPEQTKQVHQAQGAPRGRGGPNTGHYQQRSIRVGRGSPLGQHQNSGHQNQGIPRGRGSIYTYHNPQQPAPAAQQPVQLTYNPPRPKYS